MLIRPETKFIADIVNRIINKLRLKVVSTPPHLTGIDTRAEDINFWLKDKNDAEVLAICGMAGSGKTTLAKYIYDSNGPKFESSSFLDDIGKICEQPYGLCALQEQLLVEISGDKKKELDVTSYKSQIVKALESKRVLIVLDDIDKKEQLEALLGMEKIKTESKIIITSRLPTLQLWFESPHRRCKEHKLELLNESESLELLCWHAFGSKLPMEGFKELALKAVQYCLGNPLALKMLGSLFVSSKGPRKRNNIEYWTHTLNLLEREPNYRIQGILRMSFEYLPFITYRELFLHIACFFIGEDEDYVVKILEPDYCATAGIITLISRCLLTVSPSKKLMMHGLFIEMARRMVVEESPTNPAKRSRIWCNDESYTLLRQGDGSETIEGLALDMRMVREENHTTPSAFDADSLAKMDNLKLLQLNYVKLFGSYDDFPEDLRWLCWHGFHLGAVPSDLFMGNLVAIDMSYSKLQLFDPPMEIDYEGCTSLLEIEGLLKLVPVSKIEETNLKHMKWLKLYQNHELCLIGNLQLTVGRSWHIQMLSEFGIMSTFLPNIKDHNITCDYMSQSSCLSFDVPPHSNNHMLRGLNVAFKYKLSCDEQHIWPIFAKISNRTKGMDWIYNPMVFGRPAYGEVAIWFSYWAMENLLDVGDKVYISIIVESGLEVHECGASLVYEEGSLEDDTWQNNTEWDETINGDLSAFQLSMETYYLCRRDFFKSMEVDGPTPSWFQDSFGYKIDYTEIQGWRKTGRSQKFQP